METNEPIKKIDYYFLSGFKTIEALDLFSLDDLPDPREEGGEIYFEFLIPLKNLRKVQKRERLEFVTVAELASVVEAMGTQLSKFNDRVEFRLASIPSVSTAFCGFPILVDALIPSMDSSLFRTRNKNDFVDELRTVEVEGKQNIDFNRGRLVIKFKGWRKGVSIDEAESLESICAKNAKAIIENSRKLIGDILTLLKFRPVRKTDLRMPKPTLLELNSFFEIKGLIKDAPLNRRPITIEVHGPNAHWARIPLIGDDPDPNELSKFLNKNGIIAKQEPPYRSSIKPGEGERLIWVQLDQELSSAFSAKDAPWWRVQEMEKLPPVQKPYKRKIRL
jgi:hypothetical protein